MIQSLVALPDIRFEVATSKHHIAFSISVHTQEPTILSGILKSETDHLASRLRKQYVFVVTVSSFRANEIKRLENLPCESAVTDREDFTSQSEPDTSESGSGGIRTEQGEPNKAIASADPSKAIESGSKSVPISDGLGQKRRRTGGEPAKESSIDSTDKSPSDPEAQIVNYVVNAIQDGSNYLLQHQSTVNKMFLPTAGWSKPDVTRFSAEELYRAYGKGVEKAHLYSRYSMLTECLFAVVITLPNGRLWSEQKWGEKEEKNENERRRFRARVGAFIIDLVNNLAATLSKPRDKPEIAYFICFALMGEDASQPMMSNSLIQSIASDDFCFGGRTMKRVTNDNRKNIVHKTMAKLHEDVFSGIGEWRNLDFAYLFDPADLVRARDLE